MGAEGVSVSLRSRLWSVMIVLALLPLLVGAVVASLVVPDLVAAHGRSETRMSAGAVGDDLASRCRAAGVAARITAVDVADGTPLPIAAASEVGRTVDYAAILDHAGAVLAESGVRPAGLGDLRAAQSCSTGRPSTPVLVERVPLSVPTLRNAEVLVAVAVDLSALTAGAPSRYVALLDGGRVIASTSPQRDAAFADLAAHARGGAAESGSLLGYTVAPFPGVPLTLLVAEDRPDPVPIQRGIALACVGATVLALAMGWWIARSLTQPLDELAEAAERFAKGDLDVSMPVHSGEVGRLSERFKDITLELRRTISELERSRAEMGDSLQRLGETLMNTHDLDGLLSLVLETAVTMSGATAGAALALAPEGREFVLAAEHELESAGLTPPRSVTAGRGVLGTVAATAETVHGRFGTAAGELVAGPGEPAAGHVLATPLRSGARVVGLLGLYRPEDGPGFSAKAAANVRTLAGQAGIAVDNVMLHREAQRLSITDGLTGLWNFRYLSMSLAREIERASRFDRPLVVLMLDLDRFKAVNDTYGHACGDAVLREVAVRVREQVREVDTFARYGGEEFVLVLPETTVEGATMLAERICADLRRDPFEVGADEPLVVTISIGVAAFPIHGGSPATLMRAADEALYLAKRAGRDTWRLALPPGEDAGRAIRAARAADRLTASVEDLG